MALVRDDARSLLGKAEAKELHELLAQQARVRFDAATGVGEVRSWENSLPPFLADVVDAGLGHVEVLLEHRLPYTPKRVDALLCGVHPTTGRPSYVLVELKQWTTAESAGDDLVRVPQYGDKPVLHPAEQVRRYCRQLVDFTPMLAREADGVYGIAYLHNAGADGWRLRRYTLDEYGRLYTRDERQALIDLLRSLLSTDERTRPGARRAADELLAAPTTPSKQLLQHAAAEVKNREQFVLLDEQQVAYSTVKQAVELARDENTKTVVIVLGGPGSGKSVVALSLLGDLFRDRRRVMHATGSSSFTSTLRKIVIGSRSTRVQQMFVYFNSFIGEQKNSLDMVICDEAHRIRETSVNRFTRAATRAAAKPQVQELIDIARVPVFLLDEHQVVRPGEMGTEAEITAAATAAGCGVRVVRLEGQYRCGGSEFYEEWVLRLLGLVELPPIAWSALTEGAQDSYRVAALPTPRALESWLLAQNPGGDDTARIAAGYCWPWSDPVRDENGKRLVDDVVIGDWRRPWNAKDKGSVPGAPASHFWASDPRGFGQVGCIYTAQGFEYDWSGVIIGDDFVRRGDRWVARRDRSHDGQVRRATEEEFPALVRNTYKVLLTRGMKATAVYSTDPETQEFLERMAR
ncbi:DNA/RNA helicase domain-containing protein [Pseudonocardia sp.]|uniref:DNA/RNA helicase domain-containing protein n=1 Tax=Pseudonocardia sp. TaxID=60912 RepID=UPI002616B58A|nr:DNA/RNA helicase domain-containing protein [Pseudonocardia sp.]